MTMRIPRKTGVDRILETFGKKRAVYIGTDFQKFGPYAHMLARKEPILRTLLRKKGEPLEEGCVFLDDLDIGDSMS